MKTTLLTRALLAAGLLASGFASAQTTLYSRTESITYNDNTTKWVLGQTKTVTCVTGTPSSTGCDNNAGNGSDVVSSTVYDVATALPLTYTSFGKLQTTATYNADGTLATVKDGNNKTTTFSNWKRGIPQNILYADSTTQAAAVNSLGWIDSVSDENNYKTCYGYDAMGRLSGITYTSEASAGVCNTTTWLATTRSVVPVAAVEYGIAAGHWRETVTTGNATKITYYDAMWRPLLVREYDASNMAGTQRFTKTAYDGEGRVSFAAYPMASVTLAAQQAGDKGVTTYYDPLGRVSSTSQDSELGLLTTLTSYETDFTTKVTNPRVLSTTSTYLTYDQPGTDWPLVITAPESATTTIARDTFGKPTSLTRSGGGVTPVVRSYAYYSSQELCRTVEPETGATLFGYDPAGNLTWSAAGLASSTACLSTYNSTPTAAINLRKASRTYDNRNRMLTLAFPDSNGNQTWTYTPDGLPSTVSTNNGGNVVTNGYVYNKRRLITGESMVPDTLQPGWGMGYGYNNLGQVISEAYPAQVVVNYTVNALGQTTQTSVGVPALGTSTVVASNASYYPNGALKQFTFGNGIVHTMTQNARQLPSRSTDGTVLDLGTSFDQNGNVAGVTDYTSTARQTKSMVYDNLDRLSSATSPMFGTASYTYDVLDNLKTVVAPGRIHTYVYDTNNRLTNVMSGGLSVIGLTYDVQGNLANKNGVATVFDYGNRLRTTTGLTYRYDAEGRRVRLDNAGGQLKYSYYAKDGRLVWQRDEPASKRISNVYLAGSLIAEFSRPIAGQTETLTYLHTDALGSPIAKTNAIGTRIETSEYEPYGKLLNRANDDRAGYTGHVMDAASGLTYMQQRYYDPQIGRFLSVDPVTADTVSGWNFNRYNYAANNPYKFKDPDGRRIKIHLASNDPQDREKTILALNELLSKPAGAQLVQNVQRSEETVTINAGNQRNIVTKPLDDAKAIAGKSTGSMIEFNPNKTVGGLNSEGSTERPNYVDLGHDMGHAYALIQGTQSFDRGSGEAGTTPPSEEPSMEAENAIRNEHDLPLRPAYYFDEP